MNYLRDVSGKALGRVGSGGECWILNSAPGEGGQRRSLCRPHDELSRDLNKHQQVSKTESNLDLLGKLKIRVLMSC